MILNFRNRETGKPNQPDVLKSVINKLLPEEINPKIHHFLREQSEKKKHEDGEIWYTRYILKSYLKKS